MSSIQLQLSIPGCRYTPWILAGLLVFAAPAVLPPPCLGQDDFTQYVDPFIGSGGVGHTFPGATYPLGLVQLSPDTGIGAWEYCSGYQFDDTTVDGFSHTHLSGGGGADLGDVLILPFSNDSTRDALRAPVDKDREKASPGYYTTFLENDQIQAELTVSQRTGLHRYTFRKARKQLLVRIDRILWSYQKTERGRTYDAVFNIESPTRITGSYDSNGRTRRSVFFAIEFDQPLIEHHYLDRPDDKQLVVRFADDLVGPVLVRVGISTVSVDGALGNLREENLGRSFEQLHSQAVGRWNEFLSIVRIQGSRQEKVAFYSAIYRLLIQPNNLTDTDGRYRGGDRAIHRSPSGSHYSTLALWDTFRAAHPLYTILLPQYNVEFVNSLLRHYREAGYLPVWGFWGADSLAMIGNHAVAVTVDAILKELGGVDEQLALRAIKDTLTKNHWRKYDWSKYDPYGYFPVDLVPVEPVSRTLEAAFDDWCAAQLAARLGAQKDQEFFLERSRNYQHLYDSETGFFRGRHSDGAWREPFDPFEIFHAGSSGGDYTEGNAWQWLWSVQHNPHGLVELLGGKQVTVNRLEELLSLPPVIYGKGTTTDVSGMIGQYAHGNEPSHHVAYLFNYAGAPHRTQELVRQILHTQYRATPDGHCGNDDYGQLSAWYVFSSLGFYPLNPTSGYFDLGIPSHAFASIDVGEKQFVVRAPSLSAENRYVARTLLNGVPLSEPRISYQQIMAGGELVFELTDRAK